MSEERSELAQSKPLLGYRQGATFVVGISASICATILLNIVGSPILRLANVVFSRVITPFYLGYVDGQYGQAALGPTNAELFGIAAEMNALLAGLMSGVTVAALFSFVRRSRHRNVDDLPKNNRNFVRYLAIALAPLSFVGLAVIVATTSSDFVSIQAYSTFDVRLRALAPFISDQEQRSAIGRWALVASRKDYDEVNGYLDSLAHKYHAIIPKPLI